MKKCFLIILVMLIFSIVYGKEYEVVKGDTLWKIANNFYKNPFLWKKIFDANIDKIKNPDLIYPKQVFVIPELSLEQKETLQREKQIEDTDTKKEEKILLGQTNLEDSKINESDNETNDRNIEILFDETILLGEIVDNKEDKLFYIDGDTLYFSLLKNTYVTPGEILYIFHKGPSKYDVSLQNIKSNEVVMIGKARVKNVMNKIVELYLIRAYSPIVVGDFVVR